MELESRDHLTATGAIRDDGSFVLGTYKSNGGACAGRHGVIVIQLIINDSTFKHSKDHGRTVDPGMVQVWYHAPVCPWPSPFEVAQF